MTASPTLRSLTYCRKNNWLVGVTEKWNPHSKTRHDLFGFIDLLAVDDQPGVLGIQATSDSNVSARVAKIRTIPAHVQFLEAGNRIQVWGWGKKKPRGTLVAKWSLRIVHVTLQQQEDSECSHPTTTTATLTTSQQ